jgi:hypothetical protein
MTVRAPELHEAPAGMRPDGVAPVSRRGIARAVRSVAFQPDPVQRDAQLRGSAAMLGSGRTGGVLGLRGE